MKAKQTRGKLKPKPTLMQRSRQVEGPQFRKAKKAIEGLGSRQVNHVGHGAQARRLYARYLSQRVI